jgi:hypothetical protein
MKRHWVAVVLLILGLPARAEMVCVYGSRHLYDQSDLVAQVEVVHATTTASMDTIVARPLRVFRGTFRGSRSGTSFSVYAIRRSFACCHVNVSRGDKILLFAYVNSETGMLETDQCKVFAGPAAEQHIKRVRTWGWLWRLLRR